MNDTLQQTTASTPTNQWQDWFEADHFPFSVQASIEADVLAETEFNALQEALQSKLSALLAAFADTAKTEQLLSVHALAETFDNPEASWEFEWMLCTNVTIQAWNEEYRQKNTATDVLSFPAFEDPETLLQATDDALAIEFFNQQRQQGGSLGTIVVSWHYAKEAIQALHPTIQPASAVFQEALIRYILERFCHGCLHLLGLHHETQEKYNRVVALQAQTLKTIISN